MDQKLSTRTSWTGHSVNCQNISYYDGILCKYTYHDLMIEIRILNGSIREYWYFLYNFLMSCNFIILSTKI